MTVSAHVICTHSGRLVKYLRWTETVRPPPSPTGPRPSSVFSFMTPMTWHSAPGRPGTQTMVPEGLTAPPGVCLPVPGPQGGEGGKQLPPLPFLRGPSHCHLGSPRSRCSSPSWLPHCPSQDGGEPQPRVWVFWEAPKTTTTSPATQDANKCTLCVS